MGSREVCDLVVPQNSLAETNPDGGLEVVITQRTADELTA